MNRSGTWFQTFLALQLIATVSFSLGVLYKSIIITVISITIWYLFLFGAQKSYDNLLKRIEDLEKKKENNEND